MIKHIVECFDCGFREEREMPIFEEFHQCPSCGGKSRVVYDWGTIHIDIFKPFISENISSKPTLIESKQDWARKCEANGVVSHALESGYKTYGRRREI